MNNLYHKGKPKFKGSKRVSEVSGINISLSKADSFNDQIQDVIHFLNENELFINNLRLALGKEGDLNLDFGIEIRSKSCGHELYLPVEFSMLVGKLKILVVI